MDRPVEREGLLKAATEVLNRNWQQGYTAPSLRQYPHQWSWDSGFTAIGYCFYDQQRAEQEVLSMLRAQWADGMLPHIRYNPRYAHYFPDAAYWKPLPALAPQGVSTSSIVQPPVITIASYYIYRNATDLKRAKAFITGIYEALLGFHRFLFRHRDPYGNRLVCIVHPWESGMDDSPAWQELLDSIDVPAGVPIERRGDTLNVPPSERPDDSTYSRYLHLIELFKSWGYEQHRMVSESPFLVYDVLFNSLVSYSIECLIELAKAIGRDYLELEEDLVAIRRAIDSWLWNEAEQLYVAYDIRSRRPIAKPTAAGLAPLIAGIPAAERAERLHSYITHVCQCRVVEHGAAIPSYSRCEEDFQSDRYWMGPVWTNINWIVYRGLKRYGYDGSAEGVKRSMLELIDKYGFYEYFDPVKMKGCGIDGFSWTAALAIAMCCE